MINLLLSCHKSYDQRAIELKSVYKKGKNVLLLQNSGILKF